MALQLHQQPPPRWVGFALRTYSSPENVDHRHDLLLRVRKSVDPLCMYLSLDRGYRA